MKKGNSLKSAFLIYFIIVIPLTFFLIPQFKKIKNANEKYQKKLTTYQNLSLNNPLPSSSVEINCQGDLFFQGNSPILALHIFKDNLYFSSLDKKLTAVNIQNKSKIFQTEGKIFTDFFSNSQELFAADILENQIVKINPNDGKTETQDYFQKIGRISTLTQDEKGNFYAAGYASGNIFKITIPEKTIFTSDLDQTIDLEITSNTLYLARYNSTPSVLALDLNEKKKKIIEESKNISNLLKENGEIFVVYLENNQTKLGKITNDKTEEIQTIPCQFPLKIAIGNERIFYTSLADYQGRIFTLSKKASK